MTAENEATTSRQRQPDTPKLSGIVLDEEHLLTLTEISQACAVQTGYIIELVDEGLLTPESSSENRPREDLISGDSPATDAPRESGLPGCKAISASTWRAWRWPCNCWMKSKSFGNGLRPYV